jgi:exosortase/archaeosortase family protein
MRKFVDILLRYIFILFAGLGNLFIFYKIFSPPTFYLSAFILNLFGNVKLFPSLDMFLYNFSAVYIVDACVAGSAYYLLFILIFSTRSIKLIERAKLILIAFASLLLLNVLRISLMTIITGTILFDSVHLIFWYFISILFIIIIWFTLVKKFNIKEIPILSDVKFLIEQIKSSKRKR